MRMGEGRGYRAVTNAIQRADVFFQMARKKSGKRVRSNSNTNNNNNIDDSNNSNDSIDINSNINHGTISDDVLEAARQLQQPLQQILPQQQLPQQIQPPETQQNLGDSSIEEIHIDKKIKLEEDDVPAGTLLPLVS